MRLKAAFMVFVNTCLSTPEKARMKVEKNNGGCRPGFPVC